MLWLRALYLCNGLAVGMLYAFVPVLLQSKGFDPALIGLTTSLGSVGYTVALPIWGHIGDVVSGPRRALQLACVPAAVFVLGLSAPLPAAAIVGCQILFNAGGGPAPALTDAMAVPALKNASHEYSRLRLLTSVGAGGGAAMGGLIYLRTGYLLAPVTYALTMVALIVAAQLVPLGRLGERQRARGGRDRPRYQGPRRASLGSVGEALSGRRRLQAVLCSVLFLFLGVMAAATYLTLRISDLGGGPVEVGLAFGLASLAEVPGLLLAGWLVSRVGLRAILLASCLGFAACVASWSVLEGAVPILTTRFLSGICFGGIVVSFVLTVAQLLPARLQSTGQTLFQATGFGLAAVLANLAGGILYSSVGPVGVFGGGALCAVIGGAIGFLAVPAARQAEVPSVVVEPATLAH
jgi:MFS family permease